MPAIRRGLWWKQTVACSAPRPDTFFSSWRSASLKFLARFCLNEVSTSSLNREDNCTCRFWEGRFTCHAILYEAEILACMAYVDLNPIRAKVAERPEESEYTSARDQIDSRQVKQRMRTLSASRKANDEANRTPLTAPQLRELMSERRRRPQESQKVESQKVCPSITLIWADILIKGLSLCQGLHAITPEMRGGKSIGK